MERNISIVSRIISLLISSNMDNSSRVEANQDHLHIKVYDDDGAAGRDSIGSAKIKLDTVKQSGSFDNWVKLPKLMGLKSHGQVHVRMTFHA